MAKAQVSLQIERCSQLISMDGVVYRSAQQTAKLKLSNLDTIGPGYGSPISFIPALVEWNRFH